MQQLDALVTQRVLHGVMQKAHNLASGPQGVMQVMRKSGRSCITSNPNKYGAFQSFCIGYACYALYTEMDTESIRSRTCVRTCITA